METKELKIQIPEGYEIDRERSTFEKIVFKKKENAKPRSWEEYCNLQIINNKKSYCIIGHNGEINEVHWNCCTDADSWRNVLPSKELAEAFFAMMQLMSLRQAWIGDWKPYWNDHTQLKAAIRCKGCSGFLVIAFKDLASRPLSFPTEEMAKEFMNCFRYLLEVAKPLI